MAVRPEHDVAGLHVPRLHHELVADSVRAVQVRDPLLSREVLARVVRAHIVHLARRHEVVADHDHALRVPDLLKAHLTELGDDERHHDVVAHQPVRADNDDLSGLHRAPRAV